MNFTLLHEVVLWAMGAVLALALAVIVERLLYFAQVERLRRRLLAAPEAVAGNAGPHAQMLAGVLALRAGGASAERTDLRIQALYLAQQASVRRLLWVVDTAITLSPLLGLLGTILGIIDTFTALAAEGVSDPQAVSRGIGTALVATGAGIGIAVFCLVFNNFFLERVERVNDQLKLMALEQAGAA
ncbi:MotA/TolQ/ExbB proton channel family protein [Derxia lacustris]|uniref:MotA/TolQ/ExbB proton channel family protein n=1 Tax=Derxia lacustris TaxID=764842 RepID=UPI000A16F457|nr:MotA/TolQ/ExbB proton channel family protein [Derxia lacustris]